MLFRSRNSPTDPCTLSSDGVPQTEANKPPENCLGFYTISKGYRKVPGNKCTGGVKFDPILIPCPSSGFFGKIGIIIFIILIVVLMASDYY